MAARLRAPPGARRRGDAVLRSQEARGVAGPRLSPCPDTPSAPRRSARQLSRRRCSRSRSPARSLVAGRVLGSGHAGGQLAVAVRDPPPRPADRQRRRPPRPAEPALIPEGTADDNLPLFTAVTAAVWASPDEVAGRAYIDALVAAGFDKAAMQVTPRSDRRWATRPRASSSRCAGATSASSARSARRRAARSRVVVPVLAEGTCLVGETRPIDW